jgi:hypothetical protein
MTQSWSKSKYIEPLNQPPADCASGREGRRTTHGRRTSGREHIYLPPGLETESPNNKRWRHQKHLAHKRAEELRAWINEPGVAG